ncbi:hypothetical protein TCAL_08510 [Tigriopus californicus]|uniref:Uncharacterized protein n=2 Tax=Tigriopus californicus TaxID=6832 RepID=A0A553PL08_TIGCA|nr:serine/threonine-protein kinase PRP4 homolog isoform X1 [Tigriopus californicus]TRY78371.1 hypothetical protein TCAL_08510 [Tigriopus californicus]
MSSYHEDPVDRYTAPAAPRLSSGHSPHFSAGGSSVRRRSPHSGDRRTSRRSRSPRNSGRMADDWTRSTDAFLDTLTKSRGSFGTSPPQATYNARSRSNLPNQVPLLDFNDDRRSPSGLPRKSRSKSRSPSNKKSHRSASSSSDESAPKSSEVVMSKDEHDKLKAQRQQYREAMRKLEDQLMKLKEQRETFKAGGAKHEDLIMKENARIQKELKARILKMGEIIGQVESTLERAVVQVVSKTRSRSGSISPVPKKPKKRAQSRSPRVEEREPETKMRGNKHSDHRAPSTSSEDESKAKTNSNGSSKKKRKKRSKNSSSSAAEESDSESKRRKKKRKKDKKRSTSSSESEGSDMETQAKKKSTAKGEGSARITPSNPRDNDELMALLAKMSDAFMKSKKDCKELQARINLLESENIVLKKQVKELRTREEERIAADQARQEREIQEQAEKERSQIMEKAHLLLLDNVGTASRTEEHRGGPRTEDHKSLKDPERRHEVERAETAAKESDRRSDRPERHSRSSPGRRRSSREREERRRDRSRRDESPRRERSRKDDSPKRDRSHRETRKDAPEAPRPPPPPPPPKSDRNDKINLDDWVSQPQMKERVDPNLESIRAKVMEKRQKMQDEDKRSRWATVYQTEESHPVPHPKPVEPERAKTPEDQKLPEGPRAHVALQWGSHSKKATSPSPGSKKANAPVIGKMPGRSKRSSITPQRTSAPPSEEREMPKATRFGPRSDLKSIPPPTVVQPHPDQLHHQSVGAPASSAPSSSSSSSYGITREMYMQAITATMPTEPPPPQEALAMRYQQAQQPPKNPTPQPIDISSILAAAQQHIQSKVAQMRTPKPVMMKIPSHQNLDTPADIPLPPLPAAVDKDEMAGLDTRPPKVPTPPMPVPKTELDYMMEKHASPKRASTPPSAKTTKPSPFETEDSIEMDPEELAMLGIDPNDLTGFGAKK